MTRILNVALVAGAFSALASPVATVVSTETDAKTHEVKVVFSLSEAAVVTLGAEVSTDGGATWNEVDEKVLRVVGDANRKIAAGEGHTIVWNADRDWPGHPASGEKVRAVVRCWKDDNLPRYFVMSLNDPSVRAYYTKRRYRVGLAPQSIRRTIWSCGESMPKTSSGLWGLPRRKKAVIARRNPSTMSRSVLTITCLFTK